MSTDQGEEWNMAQLPAVGHEQFYSILAANDEMVFMHVDEPGGEILLYYTGSAVCKQIQTVLYICQLIVQSDRSVKK